jgi:hypothetical protein
VLDGLLVLAVVAFGVPCRQRDRGESSVVLGPGGATAVLDVLDELGAPSELAALDELGEFNVLVECTSHAYRLVASVAEMGDLMGNVLEALEALDGVLDMLDVLNALDGEEGAEGTGDK